MSKPPNLNKFIDLQFLNSDRRQHDVGATPERRQNDVPEERQSRVEENRGECSANRCDDSGAKKENEPDTKPDCAPDGAPHTQEEVYDF